MESPIVNGKRERTEGFSLIELLVVLTIISLLMTIVAPRFIGQISRAEESVLRENLYALRSTIDKYHADKGTYPPSLAALVESKYLRHIPTDPLTGKSDSWEIITSQDPAYPGIVDIRSGATGNAADGSRYGEW